MNSEVTNSLISSVALTQLVFSQSLQMIFAGTEKGTIRIYKFPLTGDYVELLVCFIIIIVFNSLVSLWSSYSTKIICR